MTLREEIAWYTEMPRQPVQGRVPTRTAYDRADAIFALVRERLTNDEALSAAWAAYNEVIEHQGAPKGHRRFEFIPAEKAAITAALDAVS